VRRRSTPADGHFSQDPHDPNARLFLHYGDLTDAFRPVTLIEKAHPDEVYHLGTRSHVRMFFDEPDYTGNTTGVGTTRLLEAIRMVDVDCRSYQASSSEMISATPRRRTRTPCSTRAPATAPGNSTATGSTATTARATASTPATGSCSTTSPAPSETFVTRKIARTAARIALSIDKDVYLGNLDTVRDWGHTPEYVEGMWRMLQADEPTDFVLATGARPTPSATSPGFCFDHVNINWEDYVRFDESYLRPTEVDALVGDASKAAKILGWKPQVLPPELARIMVDAGWGWRRPVAAWSGAPTPDERHRLCRFANAAASLHHARELRPPRHRPSASPAPPSPSSACLFSSTSRVSGRPAMNSTITSSSCGIIGLHP